MRLAGDIGGTKTLLSLFEVRSDGRWHCQHEQVFASQAVAHFEDILTAFLPADSCISSACFGVAGPVVNQRCQTTNLPWLIDTADLQQRLGTSQVKLLNDLEAMAMGMLCLPEQDLLELNPNAQVQIGNIAVLAAGTGLGEAILYWDGKQHQPMATEGGHCDFAPQTAQQDKLLRFLRKLYPDHVSNERVISGMGIGHLYDFLCQDNFAPVCLAVSSYDAEQAEVDRNALITQLGISGDDPLCAEVVRLFIELYGAEAGNLALKSLATGGVFIGGGIAPKLLSALQTGGFMNAFCAKGRFFPLLNNVSVKVALNPRTPLLGALSYFARTVQEQDRVLECA